MVVKWSKKVPVHFIQPISTELQVLLVCSFQQLIYNTPLESMNPNQAEMTNTILSLHILQGEQLKSLFLQGLMFMILKYGINI